MFGKKTILNAAVAVIFSAGICCGTSCEAEPQRWKRLVSSTIDILLDRDIEPPYMRGYASVEPQSAIFMPPRMERRMGILGALAEFVEMLPPPLPPESDIVVVQHHKPLPRHLRPLRKFEHFHHPVRNVHRPLIVGKHVVPHVIKRKDFVEYRKHKHHGPVAPIVVKDKFHKGPVDPHKFEQGGKKDFRNFKNKGPVDPRKLEQKPEISKHKSEKNGRIEKHGKGGIRPVSHNEKINKKNAALNRQKNIKTRISNKKITKRPAISRKQTIKKPITKKPQYRKPSSTYRRPQPKPQYRKSSSSGSRRPANRNEQYWMKKRG